MKHYLGIFLCLLFWVSFPVFAEKQVAITIDDLPYVGNAGEHPGKLRREKERFQKVLSTLKSERVPATGFVIAGAIELGQWALLEQFHQDGNIIANHTYSHYNLNRVGSAKFIADIARADKKLAPLLSDPKYFRYPYLATGRSCKEYQKVKSYLTSNNYVIVPVTIDSKDFQLNYQFHAVPWRQRRTEAMLSYFKNKYLNKIKHKIKKAEKLAMEKAHRPVKQIFLIHMNTLNAYFLADVIHLFRTEGYTFITVPEAMKDPYYKTFEQRCVENAN